MTIFLLMTSCYIVLKKNLQNGGDKKEPANW